MQFRFDFRCCLYFHGWVVGWSEDWRVMPNSSLVEVEVEVGFEVGVEVGF